MSLAPKTRDWLPISKEDLEARGWDYVDVILVSGDAYVDHPSFGHAVVARTLEAQGLRVAILPQPNWRDDLRDFKKLGAPRMFFGVTAGCMDSMVNHYTANRRLRSDDAYTPGGKSGFRPDYAVTVYTKILKQLYPDVPVMIGGIEASLRRVTHYDYWSDALKPSVLVDSGADLLVYGMGEEPMLEVVRQLQKGAPFASLRNIPQTSFLLQPSEALPRNKGWEDFVLHSHEECQKSPTDYAQNFRHIETESNRVHARRLLQNVGETTLVINPPSPLPSQKTIDRSFDLPYMRLPHPRYTKRGPIAAFEMIKFSVNLHRGCFGGCSFCTISAHQGKFIASRSKESILREVNEIVEMPDFHGTITDLGGPSANMYRMEGIDLRRCDACERPSCLFPQVCSNLDTRHAPLLDIYESVRKNPKVKHAFVGSGIRYDLFMHPTGDKALQKDHDAYFETLVKHHVSGRLKVAPEHTSDRVLKLMRKPSFSMFEEFKQRFDTINTQAGLKQQVIPYFISSHPASELQDMAELALKTKQLGYRLEQVQDFTPTPMTLSTEIYATGIHPISLKPVFTARTAQEKLEQRMFFFWYLPENRIWIRKALDQLKLGKLSRNLLTRDPKLFNAPSVAPAMFKAPGGARAKGGPR